MKDYCYVLIDDYDHTLVGAWTKLYIAVYDCVDMEATEDKYTLWRCRGLRIDVVEPEKWSAKYNKNE